MLDRLPNLHQTLSRVPSGGTSFGYATEMKTTARCRCDEGEMEEPVCHLTGKFLTPARRCRQAASFQEKKTLPPFRWPSREADAIR